MEETQSSGTTAEEIDLLDLMKKIWARRIFVLKAAGIGAIRATMLQKPGKGRVNWRQFLQSFPLKVGETFK